MNVTRIKITWATGAIALAALTINLFISSLARADDAASTAAITPPPATTTDAPASAASPDKGPFDWLDNRIPIHFTLSYTNYYDDNIYISPKKTSDYIFNISPGVNYAFGTAGQTDNYLTLKYIPTIQEYYTNSQQDAVNQLANMYYEHNFTKLKLSLDQNYDKNNQTSIQAGTIVQSSIFSTTANANYAYSDKLSIMADFNQTLSYYVNPGYSNIYTWQGGAYFLYQITPKISLGVGPNFGTSQIVHQPSQTWEQGLAHLTYNVTEKINVIASAGYEDRQFDANVPDQVSGVFSLGAYWTPFEGTSVNVNGYRHNDPSYSIGGTNYTATGVGAGIRQKMLEKFYLGLNGGYENDAYTAASVGITGARNDNYYYIHPYFQWDAEKWLQFVAYYQYSADESNLSSVSFNDNQVGFTLNLNY